MYARTDKEESNITIRSVGFVWKYHLDICYRYTKTYEIRRRTAAGKILGDFTYARV